MSCEKYDVSLTEAQAPSPKEPGRTNVTYTETITGDGEPFFRNTAEYFNLTTELVEAGRLAIGKHVVAELAKKGFKNMGTPPSEIRYEGLDFGGMKDFEQCVATLVQELTDFGDTRHNRGK